MAGRPMPKTLRWFFFILGVGTLIASGIYLGTGFAEGGSTWRLLRAVMFLLLGLFLAQSDFRKGFRGRS